MQIQIAELTSRVVAISKLSSLESNFFGGGVNCIYLHFYVHLLSHNAASSFLSAGPRGLCADKKELNNPSRMGTAFLLFFQLLERLCAGSALRSPSVPANVSLHFHV